jgi:hypothetical protein
MKKTDKKIENSLRKALTQVCEIALDEVAGFQYLTHLVSYNDFPGSLSVICVFDNDNNLSRLVSSHQEDYLRRLIDQKLAAAGIRISDIRQHVIFDSEQACHNQHGGKWHKRLR